MLALSLRVSGDAWLRSRLRAGLLPRPRRPLLLNRESVCTRALPGEAGEGEAEAGDGGIPSVPTAVGAVPDSPEVTEGACFGESESDTTGDADPVELAD